MNDIDELFVAVARNRKAKRPIWWHEWSTEILGKLLDYILWLGTQEHVEVKDTSGCSVDESRLRNKLVLHGVRVDQSNTMTHAESLHASVKRLRAVQISLSNL